MMGFEEHRLGRESRVSGICVWDGVLEDKLLLLTSDSCPLTHLADNLRVTRLEAAWRELD